MVILKSISYITGAWERSQGNQKLGTTFRGNGGDWEEGLIGGRLTTEERGILVFI